MAFHFTKVSGKDELLEELHFFLFKRKGKVLLVLPFHGPNQLAVRNSRGGHSKVIFNFQVFVKKKRCPTARVGLMASCVVGSWQRGRKRSWASQDLSTRAARRCDCSWHTASSRSSVLQSLHPWLLHISSAVVLYFLPVDPLFQVSGQCQCTTLVAFHQNLEHTCAGNSWKNQLAGWKHVFKTETVKSVACAGGARQASREIEQMEARGYSPPDGHAGYGQRQQRQGMNWSVVLRDGNVFHSQNPHPANRTSTCVGR